MQGYLNNVTKMPYPVYEALHSNQIPNYLPKTTRWTRPPKPEKQIQITTANYAKQIQTRKPTKATKAPATKPPTTTTAITTTKYRQLVTLNYKPHPAATEKSPAVNSFYDKKQHEKLNTILLAYKSSRADNEDIVDTWLKSLMSDLTTKATATQPKPLITRPIMILRYLEIVFGIK